MPRDVSNERWPENWSQIETLIRLNCGLHDLDWVGLKYNKRANEMTYNAKNTALKRIRENRTAMERYFSKPRPDDVILVGRRMYRQHVEAEADLLESIVFLGEVIQGNFTGGC